jgi:hypothetical protein
MKRIKITALFVLILLLLSSCNLTSFDTTTLLTAPLMNPSDQQMRKAISDAIGTAYEPVYPSTGNYQTSILNVDITGNGKNEALCFYRAANEQNVSFVILRSKDGKWESLGSVKSQAMGIDCVAFSELTGDNVKEIIIGWQYLSGEENALEIFSLDSNSSIESTYTGMYNTFIALDNCVTVISKNTTGKTASATLIGAASGKVSVINTVSLNNSIAGFQKIQTSEFNDSANLIYLDEELESHTYTTELLLLTKSDKLSLSVINLENRTSRIRAYTCIDADSDGIIDIPVEIQLASFVRNGVEERLSYVNWYKISNNNLEFIKSTYSSVNEPFYIELLQAWKDKITIEKNNDSERIIHFYTLENHNPMFSIRVFSRQEYTASSEQSVWQEVASHGENVYTYRQDGTDLPKEFRTDLDSISKLFVVLS